MRLADFDHAKTLPGYRYELSRGIITVSDIPGTNHLRQFCAINQQLYVYKASNPETIRIIATAAMSKIMPERYESERHPDVSIYKTDPPDGKDLWRLWIPEIVIEIVSIASEKCDYEEKPAEYLSVGVSEYWIFDEFKQCVTVLRRVGEGWQSDLLGCADRIKTPLLPGFSLDIRAVFFS